MNSKLDMDAVTALREHLSDNGYTPLPLVAKQCFLPRWSQLVVNRHIRRKWRRLLRYRDTGIRLDDGLAVIDIDIDDRGAVDAIMKQLAARLPGSLLLVRHGNGAKVAIFIRTSEQFGRISTRRWIKPGETEEDGAHGVEIFGGASSRYFGAFGECGPGRVYRWAVRSPIDTRLDELPIFTKAQFFAVLDTFEEVLKRDSWRVVERSTRGENAARPVRDLTADMLFHCNDGVTRTLADLEAMHRSGDLRCSASWLEGPTAVNTSRCIIGATANGVLTIWETASGVLHMPKPAEIDMSGVKAKISRIKELLHAHP